MKYALIGLIALMMSGCGNYMARNMGGTETIELPPGQKLKFATWKELDIWYATEPRKAGELPATTTFQQKSNTGLISGTVLFVER